jgi:hypothetical protein
MKIFKQEIDSALGPLPKVDELTRKKDHADYILQTSRNKKNNPPTKEDVYFGKGMTTRHREYLLDLLKTQRIAKNLCTTETEGLYLFCARSMNETGSFQGRTHCEEELMNLVFCTFPGRNPHESS